jgi:hypothetical protein
MGIKNKYFAGYFLRYLLKNTSIDTAHMVEKQIKYLFLNNLNNKYMKVKKKRGGFLCFLVHLKSEILGAFYLFVGQF